MFWTQHRLRVAQFAQVIDEATLIVKESDYQRGFQRRRAFRGRELSSRAAQGQVRVSQLAYASWSALEQLAEMTAGSTAWEGAASYLAGEIRSHVDSPEALLAVQRSSLIPLEVLIRTGRVDPPETPSELMSLVGDELKSH
jgi:hypothetical protein